MVFNSVAFALFFVVFLTLYYFLQQRILARNILIIAASYFFYGWWDVRFLTLVALSTSTDYCAALGASGQDVTWTDRVKSAALLVFVALVSVVLARRDYWILGLSLGAAGLFLASAAAPIKLSEPQRRKAWLLFSLIVNFGLLFLFKYFNFFVDQALALFRALGLGEHHIALRIVLPVGLSFFTFQATGRTIDSYFGRFKPARNIVNYAAFHAYFPQLVAGPIERAAHLMPQFETLRPITAKGFTDGLLLFLWGLFKKIVIADNAAVLTEPVFGPTAAHFSSGQALIAVIAFTFQIYGDFAGYSNMARGLASMMGFDLMRNFDIPYVARTPQEFWRRWHISLSQWLRDFIFIPLGGSRDGEAHTYKNILITMVLGGIWHGASWTFAFWGFYHGAIQVVFRFLGINDYVEKAPPWTARAILGSAVFWAVTMALVMIGWVVFRAATFGQAAHVLQAIALWSGPAPDLWPLIQIVWPLVLYEAIETAVRKKDAFLSLPPFLRYNFGLCVVLTIFALGASGGQQFIYFDF